MKKVLSVLLAALLVLGCAPVLSDGSPLLDELLREIDAAELAKGLSMSLSHFEISANQQSIFIDRPYVFGSEEYTIAYNIYDAQSKPVNYFYSLEDRVAATPGYKGLFNVFVVVTDTATGEQVLDNIGWQELLGPNDPPPERQPLKVEAASFRVSDDRQHIFIRRPDITGGSGSCQIAYNIYDAASNPVNYFYSIALDVAATPGYTGLFNVFIVVTDTVTGEQDIQNIGWEYLLGPDDVGAWPVTVDGIIYDLGSTGLVTAVKDVNKKERTRSITGNLQDKVNGRPVQAIVAAAFGGSVESISPRSTDTFYAAWNGYITFPDQLLLIGNNAFYGNTFKKGQRLVFPETLQRIGESAFRNALGLTGELHIPDSVKEIGDYAFAGCAGLSGRVVIPAGCKVGKHAFAGTNLYGDAVDERWPMTIHGSTYDLKDGQLGLIKNLYGHEIISAISRRDLEFIGDEACSFYQNFDGYTYTTSNAMGGHVVLPDHIKWIGKSAFKNQNSIKMITIGAEITFIGDDAFYGCNSLRDVFYSGTEAQWNQIDIGEGNNHLICANIHYSYTDETLIAEGDCGESVRWRLTAGGKMTISGHGAMDEPWSGTSAPWEDYKSLIRTAEIRTGVTSVGAWAFDTSRNLVSVSLPEGLTQIGKCAFGRCDALPEIRIPNSVTAIDEYAFVHCSSLTEVVLPPRLTRIEDGVFSCNSSLKKITIPASVTYIHKEAFQGCGSLTIYGYAGSAAETFARQHEIPFVAL